MTHRCAVHTCMNEDSIRNRQLNLNLTFFKFPRRNPKLLNCWMLQCERSTKIDPLNAKVCSDHFKKSDFVPDLRYGLGRGVKRRLVENAIPTLRLPPRSFVRNKSNGDLGLQVKGTPSPKKKSQEIGAQREPQRQPQLHFVNIPGSENHTNENFNGQDQDPLALTGFQNYSDSEDSAAFGSNSKALEGEIQDKNIPLILRKRQKIGVESQYQNQLWNSIDISGSAPIATEPQLKIVSIRSVRDPLTVVADSQNSEEYSLISSMEVETEIPGHSSIIVKDEVSSSEFNPEIIDSPDAELLNTTSAFLSSSSSDRDNCNYESETDPLELPDSEIIECDSDSDADDLVILKTVEKSSETNLLRKELFEVNREVLQLRQENEDLRLKLKYSYASQLADSEVSSLVETQKYATLDTNLTEIFSPAQLNILNGGVARWEDEVIKKAQRLKNLISDKAYDTLLDEWRLPIPTREYLQKWAQNSPETTPVQVSQNLDKT